MELSDVPSHVTVGGTSALFAGWLVKWLFKNLVKHHDETMRDLTKAVHALTIEVTKIGATVSRFNAVDQKVVELDKTMAVADHRIGEIEGYINGGLK